MFQIFVEVIWEKLRLNYRPCRRRGKAKKLVKTKVQKRSEKEFGKDETDIKVLKGRRA